MSGNLDFKDNARSGEKREQRLANMTNDAHLRPPTARRSLQQWSVRVTARLVLSSPWPITVHLRTIVLALLDHQEIFRVRQLWPRIIPAHVTK